METRTVERNGAQYEMEVANIGQQQPQPLIDAQFDAQFLPRFAPASVP
jgi:hypothetical protein